MSLLIAGVPMRFTIAAIHCIVDKDDQILLDPNKCQAIGCSASFIFVFDSLKRDLVTCHTTGSFDMAQFNDAELLCRAASEVIFNFYRKIITKTQHKTRILSHTEESLHQPTSKQESMET